MKAETTAQCVLDIPTERESSHAVEYSKRGYRRVLANWASDLLNARADEQQETNRFLSENQLQKAA